MSHLSTVRWYFSCNLCCSLSCPYSCSKCRIVCIFSRCHWNGCCNTLWNIAIVKPNILVSCVAPRTVSIRIWSMDFIQCNAFSWCKIILKNDRNPLLGFCNNCVFCRQDDGLVCEADWRTIFDRSGQTKLSKLPHCTLLFLLSSNQLQRATRYSRL